MLTRKELEDLCLQKHPGGIVSTMPVTLGAVLDILERCGALVVAPDEPDFGEQMMSACPRCKVGPGQSCKTVELGAGLPRPHSERGERREPDRTD